MISETEVCTKQCHRCDKPVRMSLPEFAADSQNWTTCQACRDVLRIEVKEMGPIAAARAREAKEQRSTFNAELSTLNSQLSALDSVS